MVKQQSTEVQRHKSSKSDNLLGCTGLTATFEEELQIIPTVNGRHYKQGQHPALRQLRLW